MRVTAWFVLQQFAPGHTLSKVSVVVDNEIEAALLVASVTVRDGDGSLVNFTFKVPVEPSLTVVEADVRVIAIVLVSTVVIATVLVPRSVPLPVIVTDSDAVFASDTPLSNTACGTFQLAALKLRVAGAKVIAKALLDARFKVLAAPGFPERATEIRVVPPSLTVVDPVNTGLESLSVVSKFSVEFVTAGAEAVIVTVSVVSFASSTPVRVIVFRLLQQFAPGQTLSNVTEAGATVKDATFPEAKLTTREGEGSWLNFTLKLAVEPSSTIVLAADNTIFMVFASTVEITVVAVPKSIPLPVIVTDSDAAFASLSPDNNTACGIFQLDALKISVAGESVIASGSLEAKFTVLVAPGFADKLTDNIAVPPSVTLATPLNTGFVFVSFVSILKVAFGTAGAEAVIVTVSAVSFASTTPLRVIVLRLLQH